MTIKARRVLRGLGLATLICAGWLGVLAGVARVSDAAPALIVPLGPQTLTQLTEDMRIVDATDHTLTLRSDEAGLAKRLYASGAWLVLPAGLTGCLQITKESAAKTAASG